MKSPNTEIIQQNDDTYTDKPASCSLICNICIAPVVYTVQQLQTMTRIGILPKFISNKYCYYLFFN